MFSQMLTKMAHTWPDGRIAPGGEGREAQVQQMTPYMPHTWPVGCLAPSGEGREAQVRGGGAPRTFKKMFAAAAAVIAGTVAALTPHLLSHDSRREEGITIGATVGMPGGPATSAEGLRQRVREMEDRIRREPHDIGAAVLLADALLRQARATNDGRPASRAAEALKAVLKETPAQYDAIRMLGAIYLSQHRFRDALDCARRARDLRPEDAWNYGVMGDALIELGEYDKAFEAFDTMVTMRPSAAAYARIAYARELQGDIGRALQAMVLAGRATPVNDPEAQAWYAAQIGELYLKMGKLAEADRQFRRAEFLFPAYPLAAIGRGKVKAARGDRDGAP